MKIFILTFMLLLHILSPCYSQNEKLTVSNSGKNYSYQAPDNYIFLKEYQTVINSQSTKESKGWILDPTVSDEFDTGSLDLNKWNRDHGWGNNYLHCFAYNRNKDLQNHVFETINGNKVLSLVSKKEYYEGFLIGYSVNSNGQAAPPIAEQMMDDKLPNFRPYFMTSAMLRSENLCGPYGYYEIRCKIPASRFIISDFWLWDSQENFYNEIDIFETENGKNWNVTTHFRDGDAESEFYSHSECIIPLSGYYSDDFNTYAMKWEPHRITIYLNNKIVKTFHDHIPIQPMRLYVNLGQELGRGFYNQETFPNKYSIDYLRVYKRDTLDAINRDYNPYVDFTINDKSDDIVFVNAGKPIIMNGNLPECYNPNFNLNGVYFISLQHCNSSGLPDGVESQKWLTLKESEHIERFDVAKFAHDNGFQLLAGNYYRIKLATGNPWTQKVKLIYINSCVNQINFTVNGEVRSDFSPIEVSYDNGKPNIFLDLSKTVTCDDAYFISLEPCDSNGDGSAFGNSDELQWWLSQQDIAKYSLDKLDLRQLFRDKFSNYEMQYGGYYRVKVATGYPWVSKIMIVHINECNSNVDFLINDQSKSDLTPIEIYEDDLIYHNHIYISIWPTISCEDLYTLSLQKCEKNGVANGAISQVQFEMDYKDKFAILPDINASINGPGLIDLRNKFQTQFSSGNYYRVKLSAGSSSAEKVLVIHLNPSLCSSKGNSTTSEWIESVKLLNFLFISGDNNGFHNFSRGLKFNSGLNEWRPRMFAELDCNFKYNKI